MSLLRLCLFSVSADEMSDIIAEATLAQASSSRLFTLPIFCRAECSVGLSNNVATTSARSCLSLGNTFYLFNWPLLHPSSALIGFSFSLVAVAVAPVGIFSRFLTVTYGCRSTL